jgi:GAF domain-containing protein
MAGEAGRESRPIGPARTPDAVAALADEPDLGLRIALAQLAQLTTSRISLSDMLTHVADFAVRAIPGADGAGLTLLHGEKPETVVVSAEFVRGVEAIQYGIGEGPCITAAAQRRSVRSSDLGPHSAWPTFGARVARLGVHSVLAVPLISDEEVVAALNVYAHATNAFDDRAAELGELFALPAAVAVRTARDLHEVRTLAGQLETALTSRATIDRAIGVLISRSGCTPEEGFDKLRKVSQSENRRLFLVAQHLLDEVTRSARVRRPLR